jgi:hypothetical protein
MKLTLRKTLVFTSLMITLALPTLAAAQSDPNLDKGGAGAHGVTGEAVGNMNKAVGEVVGCNCAINAGSVPDKGSEPTSGAKGNKGAKDTVQ